MIVDVVAEEDGEVVMPSASGLSKVRAVDGAVVSKPLPLENHFAAVRLRPGDPQSAVPAESNIRCPRQRVWRPERTPRRRAPASLSPKAKVRIHDRHGGALIAMPSTTRPIGIRQTGQPGPCTSSTRREVVPHAVAVLDRVSVTSRTNH